ncbi:hypothetical protein BGZ99_005759 [Dissophora globulifera]|uniref:G-protein coupled receptors family 2 profile 2 domain-containing protein n=1 Tax=Dissophora globulifera TaxID=979702 RepID=A0A9P6UYS1_9FUNG|nr:hypothetical protein BGZ99_005759 [Dissophora globulifera]
MSRLLTRATALATLALSLLATTEAVGSAVDYTGVLCKNYVDYQVWVPPGLNISTIEAGLTQQGMTAASLQQLPASCLEPFMEYACSSAFPRVEATATPGTFNVRFACKSTCQAAVTQCSSILNLVGKGSVVPNCDIAIPGTTQTVPPTGILFQPDTACNAVKSLSAGAGAGAGAGGAGNQTATCFPPFIVDTMEGPNGGTTNADSCMAGCCLPCPAQYSLYREGALETGFKITNTMRTISMVLSFILLLSYICLPDKRSHPSALILFFSICVFLFSVVVIFPLIDTRAMQCVGPINPSTQQNNLRCAIQGGILIFASVSTCAWCSALIVNLHLHTVWNSAWFARKYWLLHILCWGAASAVTAVALGLGQVRWEFATLCLIAQDKVSEIFFYPLACMIFPAFLVHCATFIHIARISAQAGAESETMSRSTLSAGAAAVISHRRHVMMAIRIQWRAALMAVCSIMCVMFYWLFYFLQLKKIRPDTLKPFVIQFVGCLMTGATHDTCADQLSPHLPPYGLMIAAEFLVSTIGAVNFIVFFKATLLSEWADWFGSIGYLMSGKRRQKKEQDQFFVI